MAKHRRRRELVDVGLGHGGVHPFHAMLGETDRGCALVAAEFLSDALELYIRNVMERKNASKDEVREFLLNLNAPVGNFGPRIKATYWFDLIGPHTYHALESVREIRNLCAHRAGAIDFQDSEILPHVRKLQEFIDTRATPHSSQEILSQMFSAENPRLPQPLSQERMTFLHAALILRDSIHFAADCVTPGGDEDIAPYSKW